jgi:transcriptional regulator with XRE-family HTH domain
MSYRISYAIMDYMQDNHKTRNDVAEELGVSPQFVSKILSGSHYMDLKDFVKWVL